MKILFITNKSLNKKSGGSVLFSILFNTIKLSDISWFVCDDKVNSNDIFFKFKKISYSYSLFFSSTFLNTLIRKIELVSFFYYFLKYRFFSKIIFFKYKKEFNSYDKIWVYVTQQSIPLATLIHKKFNIKLHLSIQDNFSTHLKFSEYRYLEKDFEYLLVNAFSIDFISDYSRNYYKNKYSIAAKTSTFLISQINNTKEPKIHHTIKSIGFAGNIWCGETILSFLKGLKLYNSLNSNKIKFFFFTSLNEKSSFFKGYEDFIEIRSFLPYSDLVVELQKCDFLYLPMLFVGPSLEVNITSFPSKIISYLNCKIPILNHSPNDSSTFDFVKKFNLGFSINSIDPLEICISLEFLINNFNFEKRKFISSSMTDVINMFDVEKNVEDLRKILIE